MVTISFKLRRIDSNGDMSYSLKGDYSGLTRLSFARSEGLWVSGTENGELVSINATSGSGSAKEAADDALRGIVQINGTSDKCVLVLGEEVTVREFPDVKTVVEQSLGRRTLGINHVEYSKDGDKL